MKLSSYLDRNLIFTELKNDSKEKVILDIVEKISYRDPFVKENIQLVKDSIVKREDEISTAMGNGIAIPHARIEGYNDVTVAVGLLEGTLECETASNSKDCVKIFFVIISGLTKNKTMLNLMRAITKFAMNYELLQRVYYEFNPDKIIEYIKESNIEVMESIHAEDIMSTDIEPARFDDTLEKIAKRFVCERRRGIPVLDKNDKFVGEITERELIECGMPNYVSLMDDLSFLTVGEPFEDYFKNEKKIKVKDIYRKKARTVERKAHIMEVAFLMLTKGMTRIYVVENDTYYGMIIRGDLIRKVLHI